MAVFILVFISLLVRMVICASVTLTELPAYESQRPCVQSCFYWGSSTDGGPDLLADEIGCEVDPIENDCLCRPDLQGDANSYLRSCVNEDCEKTLDVNSALKIYNDYCTNNGFTSDSTTTADPGTQDPPATVTVTTVYTAGAPRVRPALAGLAAQVTAFLR